MTGAVDPRWQTDAMAAILRVDTALRSRVAALLHASVAQGCDGPRTASAALAEAVEAAVLFEVEPYGIARAVARVGLASVDWDDLAGRLAPDIAGWAATGCD